MPNDAHGNESDNSQGTTPSDAPKYLTAEDFNKAMSARLAAYEKSAEKKLKEMMSEALNGVASTVDNLLTEKLGSATVGSGKKSKESSSDEDPVVRGLKKQIDDLMAKTADAEKRAASESARLRDVSLRQKLGEELGKLGIDGTRAKHAVGFLVDAEKRVGWGEDDSIVFKDADGFEVDLSTGIKSWGSTDEAKMYMPPRGTVGSGERPSGSGKLVTGKGQLDREALNAALFKAVAGG